MGGCSSGSVVLLQDAAAAKQVLQQEAFQQPLALQDDPPDVATCSSDSSGSDVQTLTSSSVAASSVAASSVGYSDDGRTTPQPAAAAPPAAGQPCSQHPKLLAPGRASLETSVGGACSEALMWVPLPRPSHRLSSDASRRGSCSSNSSAGSSASAAAGRQQAAHEALEATLQQIVALPFGSFTRAAPPSMEPGQQLGGRASGDAGSAAFACLDVTRPVPAQVEELLTAAIGLLSADAAILTINSTRRVWIRSASGFRPGAFPWCWAAWQDKAPAPQLLLVPDTLAVPSHLSAWSCRLHAALQDKLPPQVRFFAGVPLLSEGSGGLVLGSLSLVAAEPKPHISAAQRDTFAKFAVAVAAELSRDLAAKQRLQERPQSTVDSHHEAGQSMRAALDSSAFADRAVLFVDCARADWQTLHANSTFTKVTGISAALVCEQQLWRLFRRPMSENDEAWLAACEVAACGGEFILRGIHVAADAARGTFSLHFRPADQGGLDDDAELMGLPAQMPSALGEAGHPYFVTVAADTAPASMTSPVQALNESRGLPPQNDLIEGLQVGPLIGRGSFGNVYRGRYKGRRVAVKVCTGNIRAARGNKTLKAWRGMEALQCKRLRHPNIVAAIKHTTVLVQAGSVKADSWSQGSDGRRASGSSGGHSSDSWPDDDIGDDAPPAAAMELETWLVMEYCNRGTLRSGVGRGYFSEAAAAAGKHSVLPASRQNSLASCHALSLPGTAASLVSSPATPKAGAGSSAFGPGAWPSNVPVVLAAAAEVASAMAYLHARGIVHGDLNPANVLLTSDATQPHGFTCKIADFGMSRELKQQAGDRTASFGTINYMPVELLLEQQLSTACDVYSFGVMLWELATGLQAWAGLTHMQVIAAVTVDRRRLAWPLDCHPGIMELSDRCMDHDPAQRPTFIEIQDCIAAMQ